MRILLVFGEAGGQQGVVWSSHAGSNMFFKINYSHNLKKEAVSWTKFELRTNGGMCDNLTQSKHP